LIFAVAIQVYVKALRPSFPPANGDQQKCVEATALAWANIEPEKPVQRRIRQPLISQLEPGDKPHLELEAKESLGSARPKLKELVFLAAVPDRLQG
jgi:hypothetical protein